MSEFKVEAEVVPTGEVVTESLAVPEPVQIEKLPTKIHEWKSVKFMMQADIAIRGLQDPRCRQVLGRAIGERDDLQTFSIAVDIPWVMPEDYRWQPKAKDRLDSFCMDLCSCESRDNESRVCAWHDNLARRWAGMDHMEIRNMEGWVPADMPSSNPGPALQLELMHRDYPWARFDRQKKQWVCLMCGFHADAADNNSTWRNQFINKHSACGYVDPYKTIPASIEDKVLMKLGERMEEAYNRTGQMMYDSARAFILNQRGTLVIEDKPAVTKELLGK